MSGIAIMFFILICIIIWLIIQIINLYSYIYLLIERWKKLRKENEELNKRLFLIKFKRCKPKCNLNQRQ